MKKILFLMLFIASFLNAQSWVAPYNTTSEYRSSSIVVWDSTTAKYYNPSLTIASGVATLNIVGTFTAVQLDTVVVKQGLIITELEGVNTKISSSNTKLDDIKTSTDIRTPLTNPTFGHGLASASTSAIAIGSGATKTITITNNTSGGQVRYGGAGVTLANGTLLNYLDSFTINISNLSLLYVISPTSCDVTYTYGN